MELHYFNKMSFLILLILLLIAGFCVPLNVNGATKVILHTEETGGEIDRIYHRRNNEDQIIETDFNWDTEMDEYIFIPDGRLVRIEQDTDYDIK